MASVSRRDVLAGLGAAVVVARGEERQSGGGEAVRFAGGGRRQDADALVRYFAANAEQLLRPAGGILKYPSISPSLPGKQYSTQLWDWDTLWTSQGLFRLAALTHDDGLKQKL